MTESVRTYLDAISDAVRNEFFIGQPKFLRKISVI